MGSSFNFALPRSERPLAEALARVPRSYREQAEKGFRLLAQVEKEHYAAILRSVVAVLESRRAPEDLEEQLGISKSDTSAIVAASMISVPMLGEGTNPEELLAATVKAGIISQELVPQIRPFIDAAMLERLQIERAMRRATLSSQVVPVLRQVEIVVDLRVAFEQQAVVEALPMAIIHIDTDAMGEEIWFQATKRQMERLRSDIDAAIKQMDVAESWSRRGSES